MLKVDVLRHDAWAEPDAMPVFTVQVAQDAPRIRLAAPTQPVVFLSKLVETLRPPLQLLYVLHTPRGEGEPGRYQSEEISFPQFSEFLRRYALFFVADARYDLWIRSSATGDLLVWDRHNEIYIYGDLERFCDTLIELGYVRGQCLPLGPHRHHYRPEFDADAAEVLCAFRWSRTPLRPEDEQWRGGRTQ